MENIVILGGGVGGTIVANLLAKELLPDEAKIVLVDPTGRHVYQPGFLSVAFGRGNPAKLVRDERRLLRKRVQLLNNEAVRILPRERTVVLSDGSTLRYERLVVALGARIVPEELPGFQAGAHHFHTLDAAILLRRALASFRGGRVVIGVASVPYKCPPTPVEAALQLDYYFTRRGIRDRVDIHLLSPLSRVFPLEQINPVVERLLAQHYIRSTVFFNTLAIDPGSRVVTSVEGESVLYDLLVMVPPHRGPKVVEDSGLADRGGWLPVDRHTLRAKAYADIFALGDCTDLPVSKSGAAAHFQAKVVAGAIVADLRREETKPLYDGKVICYLDAGYHRALAMTFDYEHPPVAHAVSVKDWLGKQLVNRTYWTLVPRGRA